MTLLAPLALVLLSLLLVVLAFHIRRRRTLNVPSLVIWRQVSAGQVKRNRVLQWPNPSWSLLLQLLAVLALVLALAQPLLQRGEAVDHWIFVLDRSGPMQATDDGITLLEAAKARLSRRLEEMSGDARLSLIALGADSDPIVARQPSDDARLSRAVSSVSAEDGPAGWMGLDTALQSLIVPGERTRVVVYSDRAPPISFAEGEVTQEVVALTAGPNAALFAQMVPDEAVPGKWTMSGSIRLDPGLSSVEMVLFYAGNAQESPLEWTRRTIGNPDAEPSQETDRLSFSVPLALPGPGIVSVRIEGDSNAVDNAARFIVADAPATVDILYIGEGNQPLLAALKGLDGTAIYQAPGLPADVSQYGLVVVDNRHVGRQPETNVLWIGDAAVGGDPLPALASQSATGAQADHPLMRNVPWATLTADAGFAVEAGDVLLRAGDVPLISVRQLADGRDVTLAFDPRQSNWAMQPSLPIFAANLVRWLGVAPQGLLRDSCVVGQMCQVDARLESGTVRRLDEQGQPARPLFGAHFQPMQIGLYEISKGERTHLLAVNPVPTEMGSETSTSEANPSPMPLWPWLIGLAAVVLVIEAVVSGRGPERFLHAEGLRGSNPLSTRRRVTLILHGATLVLVVLALIDVPLPHWKTGETLVQVLAPGGERLDGNETVIASGADYAGDMTAAIRLAAANVPWGEPGHILVSGATVSDRDRMLQLAGMLAQRDIVLDSGANVAPGRPVTVAALDAPEPVFGGDTFQLSAIVHAQGDTGATLRFTRDGETLVEQSVALIAGDNRVDTIVSDVAEGSASYRLDIVSADGASAATDSFSRIITAGAAGQIAVIANDPERGAEFVAWLESQDISGVQIEPDRAPYRVEEWKEYDGAVLLDVPAIALTTLQQEQLEQAVAEQGLGLLLLGGPNSFGPGGYLETPLDRMSPLSSRVPRDAPEATLVFVLDRSGSMQQPVGNGTRLDIAKQATLAAIRLLNRSSQVGIIVFDSEPTAVLPLARIDDPEAVSAALSGVDPGGGTSVYPGLQAAFEMLRNVDTPARHVIVMTDGLSQPADFAGLLSEIRAEGITVSSVSIGQGAERTLIEEIARLGGGSFHATDDFAALPSILSQEAMLLSGSPVEEGLTQPLWVARDEPFLRGLPARMPPISGFVLTTAKPEAELSMVVPDSKGEPMPLLASWRFGAGQVLALSTEAIGPWSSQWQELDSVPALWAQALRQFLSGVERGPLVLDVARRGDGFVADLVMQGQGKSLVPALTVAGPDGVQRPLPLTLTGVDRYQAAAFVDAAGAYTFAANAGSFSDQRVVAMNYPMHLGTARPDPALTQLASLTGGAVDVVSPMPRDVPGRWLFQSIWPFWLALALAALILELAVRYTGLLAARRQPTVAGPTTNKINRQVRFDAPVSAR